MFDSRYLSSAELDAIDGVLAAWRAEMPTLGLLAMLPENEKARIPDLQAACKSRGIPLLGAVFPALVVESGFATAGALLLCFRNMPPGFLLPDLHGAESPAAQIAAATEPALSPVAATGEAVPRLFLIFDSMVPDIASILHGLYLKLHRRVSYAGVNAGSESFQPMPCLFDADRLVGNGVLGLLLPGDSRLAVQHGYPVSQSLMKATSTTGNRINSIDGRPALEVYQEVIRAEYGVSLTRENFYDYAVHYPFGVVTALDVLVRIPVAVHEDGSLFCVGEVPPGAVLRLLKAPSAGSSLCAEMVAAQMSAQGNPLQADSMLLFYCAGRRMHFKDDAQLEIRRLQDVSGARRIAGALSLGEIDSDSILGMPRFHNATLVCLV